MALGLALALIGVDQTTAAVTPVVIKLESNTELLTTYTVPSNKVLVVDAIQFSTKQGSIYTIEIVATNDVVIQISRTYKVLGINDTTYEYSEGLCSLNRSIKIPAEFLLRARRTTTSSSTNTAAVFGSLVDEGDLYAQTKPCIQAITPTIDSGVVSLKVLANNESVIAIEQVTDLATTEWKTVRTFATADIKKCTVDLSNVTTPQAFFRLRTLSREF